MSDWTVQWAVTAQRLRVPGYEILSLLQENESHQGLQSDVADKVSEALECFGFLFCFGDSMKEF